MSLVALLLAIASAGSSSTASPPPDGKALYLEHCASCHGKEGGGDGPLAVDLVYKPRAFKEGKFAFGNTTDAMVKTMMSGIPGAEKARMPPFKSVMSEAEIQAVVEYVRTLMPAQPTLTATDMKMDVTDTAKIVRGILAPLEGGKQPIPRGLLLGLPSGFTFEYATDDVRLLAVRRGDFVTRSDWEGRGGRALTPLGTVIHTAAEPLAWSWTEVKKVGAAAGEEFVPLHARLRSTAAQGAAATLTYNLLDATDNPVASVIETPGAEVANGAAGFTQLFEVRGHGRPARLRIVVAQQEKGPNQAAAGSAGASWWTFARADGSSDCLLLRHSARVETQLATYTGLPSTTQLEMRFELGAEPLTLRRTLLTRKGVSKDVLEAMTKEIQQ